MSRGTIKKRARRKARQMSRGRRGGKPSGPPVQMAVACMTWYGEQCAWSRYPARLPPGNTGRIWSITPYGLGVMPFDTALILLERECTKSTLVTELVPFEVWEPLIDSLWSRLKSLGMTTPEAMSAGKTHQEAWGDQLPLLGWFSAPWETWAQSYSDVPEHPALVAVRDRVVPE